MRDETAERPAEQVVRPDRLDLADEAQIVCSHLLDAVGPEVAFQQAPRLEPVNRPVRRNVRNESRIRPAEAAGMMDAEQRLFASLMPDRQQRLAFGHLPTATL